MEPEGELDPRIQIELESLNTATDDINKLEIELEEANSTFRILLNESTRRLKLLSKKLGSCIEKARPFYEAQEKARLAQIDCQTAAVKFQRANEIYAAAKETVCLAEQRFMSNSHEWQFDNAWQEMLNHATIKVMDAEKHKTDSHAEHHRKADVFSAAELKVQQLEDRFRRSIHKSRPYFEEKQICQDQLQTQKERIQELQQHIQAAKRAYSTSLKNLEQISEEIHKMRGDLSKVAPSGPREPGVGAELSMIPEAVAPARHAVHVATTTTCGSIVSPTLMLNANVLPTLDYAAELEKCDIASLGPASLATSSVVSERGDDSGCDDDDDDDNDNENTTFTTTDLDLEVLRQKVKVLAVRPVEGGDGEQTQDVWETELNDTVDKLDRLLMLREREAVINQTGGGGGTSMTSMPATPSKPVSPAAGPIKMLQKAEPLPAVNVSMRELPLLTRLSNGIAERTQKFHIKQRRLSLE